MRIVLEHPPQKPRLLRLGPSLANSLLLRSEYAYPFRSHSGIMAPGMTRHPRLPVIIAFVALCVAATAGAQAPTAKGRTGLDLTRILAKWTGDLDGMQQRRTIRVLTTYNRTLYFI